MIDLDAEILDFGTFSEWERFKGENHKRVIDADACLSWVLLES